MFALWFWLALAGGLSSALFGFIGRKTLKDADPTAFSWLFQVLRLALFGSLLLVDFRLEANLTNFAILGILGLTEFFSVYVFAKMHSLAELSMSTIVSRLRLVWIPLIAFIVLGETLANFQYLGIILITLGAIVVVPPNNFKSDKGVKMALLSSLIIALLSVEIKLVSTFASTSVLMVATTIPTIILYPLVMKSAKSRLISIAKTRMKEAAAFTASNGIAMLLLIPALRLAETGRVMGVYQGVSLLSVLLGIVVLKETKRVGWKLIGSALAFWGMWLLR